MLDTGSSKTYINTSTTTELSLATFDTTPFNIKLANGRIETISTGCSALAKFSNPKHSLTFEINFNLLNGCDPVIILGLDFLSTVMFTLDLGNCLYSLNGVHFEIENTKREIPEELETILLDKTNICAISSPNISPSQVIQELVGKAKLDNPTLGQITNVAHSINLTDLTPFSQKEYEVPLKKVLATKKELTRLQNLSVIRPSSSQFLQQRSRYTSPTVK